MLKKGIIRWLEKTTQVSKNITFIYFVESDLPYFKQYLITYNRMIFLKKMVYICLNNLVTTYQEYKHDTWQRNFLMNTVFESLNCFYPEKLNTR